MKIVIFSRKGSVLADLVGYYAMLNPINQIEIIKVRKTPSQFFSFFKKIFKKTGVLGLLYYIFTKMHETHLYKKEFKESGNRAKIVNHVFFENSQELVEFLKVAKYDVVILGQFGIINKKVLQVFNSNVFNVHPAKLPNYPGYAEPAHSLSVGDLESIGFTLHRVTHKLDAGPILLFERVPLKSGESLNGLLVRVRLAGYLRLLEFIETTELNSLESFPQNMNLHEYPYKTLINWRKRIELDCSYRKSSFHGDQ